MTLLGVNLRVSGYSSQGGRKYMEDSLCIAAQETEDGKDLEYGFFAVYDGHGGKEASLFAKEHLMDNIVNLQYFWSDDDTLVLKAIRDGFLSTHLAMWKDVENWPKTATGLPSTAGTTASVAFIKNGKLYTGHVGDSKIVLGENIDGHSVWQARSLTTDHKPDSISERKRIYESGGLVMKKSGVDRVVWKRPKGGHHNPVRRSTDFDKIPFLAVARSLGDLWSYDFLHEEFVVSPEPDVSVMTLDPERDCCLIVASDGLWNTLTPQEAVILLQDCELENENLALKLGITNPKDSFLNNPSKVLVNYALERWNKLKMRADNTSVISIIIEPLGIPKSALRVAQNFLHTMLSPKFSAEGDTCRSSEINENVNNFNYQRNTSSFNDAKLHLRLDHRESTSTEDYEVHFTDSATHRLSSSPLQSLNICNECSSTRPAASSNRDEGTENNPYPIPRWSKSASGQTSLSKLASWSALVNNRHFARDPILEDTVSMTNNTDSFPPIVNTKPKHKHCLPSIKTGSTSACQQFLPTKDVHSCNCDSLKLTSVKQLSLLRPTTKRKHAELEVLCSSGYDSFKCDCSSPWKRKPVTSQLNITAFKAINDFRMSQYHRLKF